MKAVLKYNRKVVDVVFIGATSKARFYKDKDGKVYTEKDLELIEFYGG